MVAKADVTGFGEIMLRLSVGAGSRLETSSAFEVHPGGAEGNMLCALSALGRKTSWVGGLPQNPLGALVRTHLRRSGVSPEGIIWKPGARMGLFFIEFSGAPRGTEVYYDRADSAAAQVGPSDLPWNVLLDTSLIHVSGITPAISESSLAATVEVFRRAREQGVALSLDVNFRRKLWSESRACEVLTPLMQGIELLFCGRSDAQAVFGCPSDSEACLEKLVKLSGAKNVVVSLGDEGAIAWNGNTIVRAEQGPVAIVDRIGAGDAMAAGVIDGWLDGDLKRGLDIGMIVASLALTVHGDTVFTSREEVTSLLSQRRVGVNR